MAEVGGSYHPTLTKQQEDELQSVVSKILLPGKGILAAEALAAMQKLSISSLVVADEEHRPVAVLHLHDLLKAGVF